MAKHRTLSAEDCVTIRVETSSRCRPLNTRVARRGKLSVSLPLMVIRSALLMEVIAFTPARPFFEVWTIFVPGQEGLKEFLIHTGIFFFITGWMVLGCRTLAPK